MSADKNYFYKLMSGKTSLLIVFWFWFIFISFLIEVFFETIFMQTKYAQNKENYIEFFLYLILLIYAIAIFLIIFKTANNYKGSKFWSFSSKLLVTINLLFSVNFFIEVSKFYFFEDYALEKEIESFKDNLPIQIDMNSTLIDIYKKDKNIYYKYQLHEVYLEDKNLKNKFKKQIQDSLCEDKSSLDLLKKDYVLNYQYIGENKEEIVDIKTDKKVCGNSIDDLEILNDVLEKQGMI
ncbi:hypothetical protein CKA55_06890 [Arcobacter suis]|uniref:Membrane protein n=1 Tax=Arcobacter suis CECT 7833 TaxID=663365 RepID=A0AAD0SQ59_9BACT|nr:hypothetical protein [Arcobacter suis]AXX89631.1 putative membrane protein [Arcobacter suis CECT 7833]RWS46728.1 hypothetical protein CKA55_06890 [Arcobacter suis]